MLVAQRGLELASFAESEAQLVKSRADFEKGTQKIRTALKDLLPLLKTDRGRDLVRQMETVLDEWTNDFREVDRLVRANDAIAAYGYGLQKTHALYEKIGSLADELTQQQRQFLADEKAASETDTSRAEMLMIVMAIISIGVAIAAVFLVRALNAEMTRTTRALRDTSNQIAQSAAQVSQSSQQLAEAASDQAASIEETSAAAEEITSMTVKNADNTASAATLMGTLNSNAGQANDTLNAMIHSMDEISSSSNQIGQIIKVIDEIAFQTNILALNAAVEAARAGEAGKGFAVVADEVRKLAQRAAQAAKDTADLIQQSIQRSGEGKQNLDRVTDSIRSITDGIVKVRELSDEVNVASQEQQRGIRQISTTINEMNSVTQTVAANSEESAASSEELNAMSASLLTVVREMEKMVGIHEDQATATVQPLSPRVAPALNRTRQASIPAHPE
jgi:methyl-accepting chemotaxis protein/methyl-accepting chemotaxis protein-1 (serine sensor receptor)